jgi:ketosteroid isomerase-like protein
VERIIGTGDRLVSIMRGRATMRYTGIEGEWTLANALTFREGRIVHCRVFREPDDALEAAGLRE